MDHSKQGFSVGWIFVSYFMIAGGFIIAASLAGIPPLSGFWAKLAVIQAAVDARSWLAVAAALIWDGDTNSWGNAKKLNSASLPTATEEPIAVQYMQGGTNVRKAVFVWAETNDIYGWTWTGSAWASAACSRNTPPFPGNGTTSPDRPFLESPLF